MPSCCHDPHPAAQVAGTVLNRAALILRYKQPFVDWINGGDPAPGSHTLTLADVEKERTVYLVEVEDQDDLNRWLDRHGKKLFEDELRGWYTDPALWPRVRSPKKLRQWCSFELNTVVVDTGTSPLEDNDL